MSKNYKPIHKEMQKKIKGLGGSDYSMSKTVKKVRKIKY